MSDTPGEKVDGPRGGSRPGNGAPRGEHSAAPRQQEKAPANNAMASLFANAKQLKKK